MVRNVSENILTNSSTLGRFDGWSVSINSKIVVNRLYRILKMLMTEDMICHWTMDVHQQCLSSVLSIILCITEDWRGLCGGVWWEGWQLHYCIPSSGDWSGVEEWRVPPCPPPPTHPRYAVIHRYTNPASFVFKLSLRTQSFRCWGHEGRHSSLTTWFDLEEMVI